MLLNGLAFVPGFASLPLDASTNTPTESSTHGSESFGSFVRSHPAGASIPPSLALPSTVATPPSMLAESALAASPPSPSAVVASFDVPHPTKHVAAATKGTTKASAREKPPFTCSPRRQETRTPPRAASTRLAPPIRSLRSRGAHASLLLSCSLIRLPLQPESTLGNIAGARAPRRCRSRFTAR